MLPLLPLFATLYRFGRSIRSGLNDPEFEALLLLLIVILCSGTLFYHDIEGWSWLDSLYFSVVTITTVGYGDLTPHTPIGKIFTMVYLLLGIGILFTFVGLIARHAVEENKDKPFIPFWTRGGSEPEADKVATIE
jgi:voltage-gated potassium channel Kch